MAVVMMAGSLLILVYSPWSQDSIRRYAQTMLTRNGMEARIDTFALHFPLNLEVRGVAVTMPDGMALRAGTLDADVSVFPLLKGTVEAPELRLRDAAITIGSVDTTMYLNIKGSDLLLSNTKVGLASMDIDVARATFTGGRVSLTINPDTATTDTAAATPPTAMKVKVARLHLSDFAFEMRMLPTIDTLRAQAPTADVADIAVDLLKQGIDVKSFTGNELGVRYIAPDSATVAATPIVPPSSDSVTPWIINIDTIGFSKSHALYTTRGVVPAPGLDFAYISADSLDLGIHNFYNCASTVRVPLTLSGTERCGVYLMAAGTLDIDETAITFKDFNVSTPNGTTLAFGGTLGSGDMTTDPSLPLALAADGRIMTADAAMMFPAFSAVLDGLPRSSALYATVDVDGTAGNLHIADLSLLVNGMARLKADGRVVNAFDFANIGGNINLDGEIIDVDALKPLLFDKATAREIAIPSTTLHGSVAMNAGNIDGTLKAFTHKGEISLDGVWHQKAENYKVDLTTASFPVNAFLPLMGVGEVSLHLTADGHGYDIFSNSMRLNAGLDVDRAVYKGYDYKGIKGSVNIAQGHGDIELKSSNPNALFALKADGNLAGTTYTWNASLDGNRLDLKALRLSPTDAVVNTRLTADAVVAPRSHMIDAKVNLDYLNYTTEISAMSVADVLATVHANDSATAVQLTNRDMEASFISPMMLDSLLANFTRAGDIVNYEISHYIVDVDTLQRTLPPFIFNLTAGKNNAINSILAADKTSFDTLSVKIANDTTLRLNARMLNLATPSMRLDTVSARMWQRGQVMFLKANIDNAPGTFDEWAHVDLGGAIGENKMGLEVKQQNIQGKQGYHVGLYTTLADSLVKVTVKPENPIIAYMPWTVNPDNFITWNIPKKHLDANLRMHSATSSLAIYTNHVKGHEDDEKLVVNITDIHIADWIKLNPFAPQISGDLSADIQIMEKDKALSGTGNVDLANFTYNKQSVGAFRVDLDLSTDLTGRINALASMKVNGKEALTVKGAVNDSTAGSPLLMDLALVEFPLNVANPFIGKDVASVRGSLNGEMNVHGQMTNPRLDGWLAFDSAAVKLAMVGEWYSFNDVKVPVDSNIVRFNDFSLISLNKNPLTVNGTVDLNSFINPGVDLALAGNNLQLVNSNKRPSGADIYGRGFVSLDASVKGNMEFMAVDANLSLLSGSTVYYVIPDAETMVAQKQTDDLVTFVNFADTAAVQEADSITQSTMAMLLNASLTIQNGSTINVDLSPTTRDRVSLQPNGTLDFSMKPFAQPRLTGRLNIPSGYVRYTPPFMSEKNFKFRDNSYVAFNGNIMNPTLSIHAVDEVKANVTQSGQNSRLVNFDIALNVTGTLENMNVAFDLSTDDDVTVANELQSMSAEQRANQAMNMLLYNIYSGPGTRGDSNISGNAVYSFLTSQLNNWAANNIKGVDLSFGVDQYDRTVDGSTSQTTSYSYQVSKSLFNDRFKIVVGGNYSTDANADENFSQNLIKDISFEYFLNKAQTMYLRLFRHTGYESILEGEITRTGLGFVYKRKSPSFRGLFLRRYRRQTTQVAPIPASALPASVPATSEPEPVNKETPKESEK